MNFNGLACAINMGRNKRIRLSFKSPRIRIIVLRIFYVALTSRLPVQ